MTARKPKGGKPAKVTRKRFYAVGKEGGLVDRLVCCAQKHRDAQPYPDEVVIEVPDRIRTSQWRIENGALVPVEA